MKYIEPNKSAIKKGLFNFGSLKDLIAWDTISGLQFENLIVNRVPEIIKLLGLERETIISSGHYFQNHTTKTKAVQIDFLIECKPNNFYVCEIKHKQKVDISVVQEVKTKLANIKLPKYSTKRPVLIASGEVTSEVRNLDYFDKILSIEEVFEKR